MWDVRCQIFPDGANNHNRYLEIYYFLSAHDIKHLTSYI
jgi:hypothetical protein